MTNELYIVITNGEEVKGEVVGIFKKYKNAKTKFNEIVSNWKEYSSDNIEENKEKDYYNLIDFDGDEFLEVKIIKQKICDDVCV